MTIAEVLAAKVPEGKYKLAMQDMKCIVNDRHEEGIDDDYTMSCCAAFSALMDLATWGAIPISAPTAIFNAAREECQRTLSRRVVAQGGGEMKPLALDLCCGKGGWTKGLLATGWDVIGFDVKSWTGYPGKLVIKDVREVTGKDICLAQDDDLIKVSLVCASPPCQEFSYRSFPFKRCRELAANVPPDKSIWEACMRIAKECNAPLVLENVRGAQKYMGKAVAHYGSFYLWGDVPAILPIGRPIKGFRHPSNIEFKNGSSFRTREQFGKDRTKGKFPGECECVDPVTFKKMVGIEKYRNLSRKEWSAKAAMIPFELSRWIGECFYPK